MVIVTLGPRQHRTREGVIDHMGIFATKKVTVSTSKKGIRVTPKSKSGKKKEEVRDPRLP